MMTWQIEQLKARLYQMGINGTAVIHGEVVTRWSADAWEVGSFGKRCMSVDDVVVWFS